jgi:hypothetical protein
MITLATNKNNDKNSDIYSVSFAIVGGADVSKFTLKGNELTYGFFSRLCVGYGGRPSHKPKFGFDINTISVITSGFKSRGFES